MLTSQDYATQVMPHNLPEKCPDCGGLRRWVELGEGAGPRILAYTPRPEGLSVQPELITLETRGLICSRCSRVAFVVENFPW